MNMPFHKPVRTPAQVLVDRDMIINCLHVVEETRFEVAKALALLESGRTDAAATLLRQTKARLG